jgi:penicillin-binding protein 1A
MEEFSKAVVTSKENKDLMILTEKGEIGKIQDADVKWAKKLKPGDAVFVSKLHAGKTKGQFCIKQLPAVQGAMVIVEVNSGRILAMQGGYSFSQSEFNRATQALRQTGSAFKPFVYLAGLENGFAPNSIIDASPIEIDLGKGLGVWKPRNYHGMELDKITLRRAIERSINTATIRIAQEAGIDKIAKIAEQFGVFESMPELLSYVLGAGESTLLKLTTSYAMLANGGRKITPTMVEYIQDKHGRVIYKMDERTIDGGADCDVKFPPKLNDNRPQILSEQSIYQLTSLLEGVMQRGSGAPANFLNFPMAGKTGTSNESRDTWFIGYTPDIAIGVFIGFDDHSKSLGKNANGTNTALPIFIDFMAEAKKYLTPKPFRVPRGIKLRKIDAETGGTPSENNRNIITEAFKEEDDYDSAERNVVVEEKNSTVKLIDDDKADSPDNIRSIIGIY